MAGGPFWRQQSMRNCVLLFSFKRLWSGELRVHMKFSCVNIWYILFTVTLIFMLVSLLMCLVWETKIVPCIIYVNMLCDEGTVASIVSCRCIYCWRKPEHCRGILLHANEGCEIVLEVWDLAWCWYRRDHFDKAIEPTSVESEVTDASLFFNVISVIVWPEFLHCFHYLSFAQLVRSFVQLLDARLKMTYLCWSTNVEHQSNKRIQVFTVG